MVLKTTEPSMIHNTSTLAIAPNTAPAPRTRTLLAQQPGHSNTNMSTTAVLGKGKEGCLFVLTLPPTTYSIYNNPAFFLPHCQSRRKDPPYSPVGGGGKHVQGPHVSYGEILWACAGVQIYYDGCCSVRWLRSMTTKNGQKIEGQGDDYKRPR